MKSRARSSLDNRAIQSICAAFIATGLVCSTALACPLCHTSTAAEVRHGLSATISDKAIWLAVTWPFLSIGALIGVMNHWVPETERSSDVQKEGEKP